MGIVYWTLALDKDSPRHQEALQFFGQSTRRRILRLLLDGPMSVADLVARFGRGLSAQDEVGRQLKRLALARLVVVEHQRKPGRSCFVDPAAESVVRDALALVRDAKRVPSAYRPRAR